MSRAGEVLLATIAAGGGHVATARAMAEAVAEASGGALEPRVEDVMATYAPRLDARHKESWRALLARPRLVRASQTVMDAAPAVSRAVQNAVLSGFTRRVTAALNADPPALVVVNHGWLATAFTEARLRHGLEPRVVVFATEPFDASALWSAPGAETVLAPSAAAAEDLRRLGVPEPALRVSGYPVARRFYAPPSREEARRELGLGDGFVVLMSLGAEGVAGDDVSSAVTQTARCGATLLCVTGRNEALAAELRSAAEAAGLAERVRVLGFVERMEVPLAACDLMVGKAGPASTMEALAVGRPVVTASYAGLNELAVVRFLESHGLGQHAGSFARLPGVVAAWRDQPGRLAAAREAAAALDFGGMSAGVGRYLASLALTGTADPALLAPGAFARVDKASLRSARATA